MRRKKIFRFIATFLAATIFFGSNTLSYAVLAQEEVSPPPEPTPTEDVTVTGTPTPEPTVEPTPTEEVTVSVTVTGTGTPTPTETPTPTPEIIIEENQASVSGELTSGANTGGNVTEGATEAEVTTGEAAAGGELETATNVTVGEIPHPQETHDNQADAENKVDVAATSGQNSAVEIKEDVKIDTGNSKAWANVVNLINANIVGSDFAVIALDIVGDSDEEIDLNQVWQDILALDESGSLAFGEEISLNNLKLTILNINQADLTNDVSVTAVSGGNSIENSGDAQIKSGDAVAAANLVNVVNANILGGKFVIGMINILGNYRGNIILPRKELFGTGKSGARLVAWVNQNEAIVENEAQAGANTGGNESEGTGNLTTTTGDATAVANVFSVTNTDIMANNWMFLLFNNLGEWEGKIVNWDSPGAEMEAGAGSTILQMGLLDTGGEDTTGIESININSASVQNNVTATADSGNNSVINSNGDVTIVTGKARAVANIFNLINTNIFGSRWLWGTINILGKWVGHSIFAYPDLAVELTSDVPEVTSGEIVTLTAHYRNMGYDSAPGVRLAMAIPEGLEALDPTNWDVGDLPRGGNGSVTARARATASGGTVSVSATVSTADTETDTGNNTATTNVTVAAQAIAVADSGNGDQRQPCLEITAKNNVNKFVRPGDTITYEVVVRNRCDVRSDNSRLVQKLFSAGGQYIGQMTFGLGRIEAFRSGRLNFGLVVPKKLGGGVFATIARANGEAPNHDEVVSNEARTGFEVMGRVSDVLAETEEMPEELEVVQESGVVLGGSTLEPWNRRIALWPLAAAISSTGSLVAYELLKFAKSLV